MQRRPRVVQRIWHAHRSAIRCEQRAIGQGDTSGTGGTGGTPPSVAARASTPPRLGTVAPGTTSHVGARTRAGRNSRSGRWTAVPWTARSTRSPTPRGPRASPAPRSRRWSRRRYQRCSAANRMRVLSTVTIFCTHDRVRVDHLPAGGRPHSTVVGSP